MWGRVLASRADGVRATLHALPGRVGPNAGVEFSHGRLARLAPGSAMLRAASEVTLLATVTRGAPNHGRGGGGAPLLVDFRARAAAKGVIPATWMRREMRPAASETLTARLVDRALRPVVNCGDDALQITLSQLSGLREATVPVDALAVNAASAAMLVAGDILAAPVGAARVCLLDDNLIAFPGDADAARAQASALVAVVGDRVVSCSIEASTGGISNDDVLRLVQHGVEAAQAMVAPQIELAEKAKTMRDTEGLSFFPRQMPVPAPTTPVELDQGLEGNDAAARAEWKESVFAKAISVYTDAFVQCRKYPGKAHRASVVSAAQQAVVDAFPDAVMEDVLSIAGKAARAAHRDTLLRDNRRIDGRAFAEVRHVRCEAGVLPGDVHGSAIFERGDTQVLACTTIGLRTLAQKTEEYLENGGATKRFFVHYSFPPYATGDMGRFSGAMSRRETGHSALAERALEAMIDFGENTDGEAAANGETPPEDKYPYVIRMSAEVTASDGSSSMATVCAGSLALQDAGVPLCEPVAGVAMGLITGPEFSENENDFVLLTDILGAEDYFGDMDMKVTGTAGAVTACQLDVKVPSGVPLAVIAGALERAQDARRTILAKMAEAAQDLRTAGETPLNAPRVVRVTVDKSLAVKSLLRHQAQGLRDIEKATGARLTFDGRGGFLRVDAPDATAAEKAETLIREALGDLEIGSKITVRVTDVKPSYAIVSDLDQIVEGLLHVSKMQIPPSSPVDVESTAENSQDVVLPPSRKYSDARDVVKKGDVLQCVVLESDRARGILRVGLTGPPPRKPRKSVNQTVDDFLGALQVSSSQQF